MEEVVQHLLVVAKRSIRQATGFQLECLEAAIPEGERILQELADPETDRDQVHREVADFLIRLEAGGVFERLGHGIS